MIKKHHLHIQDDAYRRVDVDQDTTPSGFLISAKVLRDWLDHFTIAFGSGVGGNVRGDSHLAWMFTDHEVRAKNFENASTSALSTEIKIDVKEFQDYGIDAERVDFSLPMREFKVSGISQRAVSDHRPLCNSRSSSTWTWTLCSQSPVNL